MCVTVRRDIGIVTFTLLILLWLHEHVFQFLFKRFFIISSCFTEFFIGNFTGHFFENAHSFNSFVINIDITDFWWPDGVLLNWLNNFLLEHFHFLLVFLNTNMNVMN